MRVRKFIEYLENIRQDDSSHLNNDLSANKNEGRLDDDGYDYDDDTTKDYGDYDDWYDDEDKNYYSGKKSSNPKFDEDDEYILNSSNDDEDENDYDDEDENDDDIQHLTYLLRQMFKNSGVDNVQITAKNNEDIVIQVLMPKKDNLRNIIRVFEVTNKLKRDILAQYDSEFDIWTAKNGGGILSFGFTLDEGLGDDNMPF